MITYQDFLSNAVGIDRADYVRSMVNVHISSSDYKTAILADEYSCQKNRTICDVVRFMTTPIGTQIVDTTVANNRIASNFFRRLNVQRNVYSLGNGITFAKPGIKELLGNDIDNRLTCAGYAALTHSVSFLMANVDHTEVFKLTEFVPLYDEITGELAAGIRFRRIDSEHPMSMMLFLPEGVEEYRDDGIRTELVKPLQPYKRRVEVTAAYGARTVDGENYAKLPIVPLWGSELRQSTLIGMRASIDAYDMVQSGFANDINDCPQIYWIIKNAGGMSEKDLAKFREKLKRQHIAAVTNADDDDIVPYTQDIPHEARAAFLDRIRVGIYEDFGAFDVRDVSASAKTATEIEAAYQPMDENADDYEYQIIEAVRKLLALHGVNEDDATPIFKRNRIANQTEQTSMLLMAADYLDEETMLKKLPFITDDEIETILQKRDAAAMERMKPVNVEEAAVDEEVAGV